jgi:hypothetical protein
MFDCERENASKTPAPFDASFIESWSLRIRSKWEPDAPPPALAFVAWRRKSLRTPSPTIQVPGPDADGLHGRRSTSQSRPSASPWLRGSASLWLCEIICQGANGSDHRVAGIDIPLEKAQLPRLRFIGLFCRVGYRWHKAYCRFQFTAESHYKISALFVERGRLGQGLGIPKLLDFAY